MQILALLRPGCVHASPVPQALATLNPGGVGRRHPREQNQHRTTPADLSSGHALWLVLACCSGCS